MTRHRTPLRPTRHRLIVAMGIAACLLSLVLALLGLKFNITASSSLLNSVREQNLIVYIERQKVPPIANQAIRDQEVELAPREVTSAVVITTARQEAVPASRVEPLPANPSDSDLKNLITESVLAIGHEKRRQEESRSSMWRQTHSVMFQANDEFVPNDANPIIPDLTFKPEIHVAGLGMTIGSCFFGIPIAGVPVEQRTVAITLVVCGRD